MRRNSADREVLDGLIKRAQEKGQMPPFRPYAIYDPGLDRVYVYTRDCSVREERVNTLFSLFSDGFLQNSEGEKEVIGFQIQQAREFLIRFGIEPDVFGEVDLVRVLDVLVGVFPENEGKISEARRCLDQLRTGKVRIRVLD